MSKLFVHHERPNTRPSIVPSRLGNYIRSRPHSRAGRHDDRGRARATTVEGGRGCWTPQTGAGTRYYVPVRAIQSAAHLVPLEPITDNKRRYLNNTVDLETFNLVY
jgi:hypothetical protein